MKSKIAALSVHLLTASGSLFAFWALILIVDGDIQGSLIVLALATLIDSIDGTFARRANVTAHTPNIEGALLDNIVDYLTWVFLPIIWSYYFLNIPFLIGAIVLISSLIGFSHKEAKTEDHFFRGFPSYWNFVILYLYVLNASPVTSSITLLTLAVMVLVPVKFVYPTRTKRWKKITLALSVPYAFMVGSMLIYLKDTPLTITILSFFYPIYYVGISILLSRSKES